MRFYSIFKDTTFKYLWNCDNFKVREFYNRIIGKRLGIDIRNFILGPEELLIDHRLAIHNRVDIVLFDKTNYGNNQMRDVSIIVNIEANSNKYYLDFIENKNLTYLLKLAGNFYTYNKKSNLYRKNINVQQFNLNNYVNPNCKDCTSLVRDISTKDMQNGNSKNIVRSYDLYLLKFKEIEYTKLTEEEKDIDQVKRSLKRIKISF